METTDDVVPFLSAIGNNISLPSNSTPFLSNLTSWLLTNQNTTTPATLVGRDDIWPWRVGLFGVGGTCIACVGTVCNVIAIIVLFHYKTKSTAPFLLICLELFDTAFLLSELFLETLVYTAQGGLITNRYRDFIRPIYCFTFPIPYVVKMCAMYMVVLITVERYTVVAWPLKAHRICRPAVVRTAVACIMVYSILHYIPMYMAYTCSKLWSNSTQKYQVQIYRTDLGNSHFYNHVFQTWINLSFSFLFPFLILIVFNCLMLIALHKSKAQPVGTVHGRSGREQKLAVMVVCMTIVFFVCELFPAVSLILTTGLNTFLQCSEACNRFTAVADTMALLNCAVNFIIYCASGKNFRKTFRLLFMKPKTDTSRQHRSQPRTGETSSTLPVSNRERGKHYDVTPVGRTNHVWGGESSMVNGV